MFCFISKNWRGQPLVSIEATVRLISSTTTKGGLRITCVEDTNTYSLGQTVGDEELNHLNITKDPFHGEWNYIVSKQIS
jgi:hypothetical protein